MERGELYTIENYKRCNREMELYVIYDKVAEESGPIYMAINEGVALRQAVQILKPLPVTTRDDYKLMRVGFYDLKTCKIETCTPVEIDITFAMVRAISSDIAERKLEVADEQ